jgi:hypothetical protein
MERLRPDPGFGAPPNLSELSWFQGRFNEILEAMEAA